MTAEEIAGLITITLGLMFLLILFLVLWFALGFVSACVSMGMLIGGIWLGWNGRQTHQTK